MPPTRTRTSVGMETVNQTVNRARQLVQPSAAQPTQLANAGTPGQVTQPTAPTVQNTGFRIEMPESFTVDMATNAPTRSEIFDRRNQMEQEQMAVQQFDTDFNALIERINAPGIPTNPLSDPNAFINRYLLRQPTNTQNQLAGAYGQLQTAGTNFATNLNEAASTARDQFGLPKLQEDLAATRQEIADKRVRLREQIRDFEVNAERRGIDRAFVDTEKAEIERKANAELADLAIQELAQSGAVTEAKTSIQELLQDKKDAFAFEEKAIQTEIARLTQLNSQEAELRADQLKVALAEKKTRDDKAIKDEETRLNMLSDAAANGADNGTLLAIRNAKTAEEATFLASPFIGRLDRLQAEASIRASEASARSANANAALNEAELLAYQKAQEDAATGVLTGEQVDIAQKINSDFESEPIVKSYNEGLQKYIVLEDTLANGIDGIQDLQLVYDFMKAVDPTSVVRETEFATAAQTGNIFQGSYARFNKNFGTGGFLPEEVKNDFIRAARASFEAKNTQYANLKAEKARQINQRLGISNGADYLTSYEMAAPLSEVDFGIVDALSGATPDDIADIISRTNGLIGTGVNQ